MTPLGWLVLQFVVCAALIARAGYVLSESTGLLAGAHTPVLLNLGLTSPVLLALYLLALRSRYAHGLAMRAAMAAAAAGDAAQAAAQRVAPGDALRCAWARSTWR